MDEGSEIFDIVDHNDVVVGQATRREVHKNSWLHRSVHILVFNSRNDLFLQKRALTKDENPGYWDSSASGHVGSGEDYLTSAHRELKEELGISGSLKPFLKFPASQQTFWGVGPASSNSTRCLLSALSRLASTQPAEPPPTIM